MDEVKFKQAVENMVERLKSIRAGRANPNILNGIMVSYYGVPTPLQSIASITVPEAKKIFIKPFEKGSLKDIEYAINEANVGITPTNNGEIIILIYPDLTEERRKEYVKQAKAIGEEGKVVIRNIRQSEKDDILKEKYSEDEEKRLLDQLQEVVNKYNKLVDEEIDKKEQELMEV